jgi:hypothetical protein
VAATPFPLPRPLTLDLPGSALPEYRLSHCTRIGLEARDDVAWDRALDQSLDIAQKPMLVDAHQRDRLAVRTRASRAANAMDIILGESTRRTSGMKPMSSMRSASSSTKISTRERSRLPCP